jgi:glycosyltransferase involved in cell wall biosynthesis
MNSKKYPLLSIVTPSYNLGAYLERAISSVLSQNYDNFEYWVIDGGSTDNTIEILKKYSKIPRFKHKFHWISEPDSGQTNALNKGLKRAKGEWFAWLNADDYYEGGAFSIVAKTARTTKAALLYGNCLTHGKKNELNVPPQKIPYETFLIGNPIYGPSAFFRKSVVDSLGGFDEDLFLWMDYDMFMRIAKAHEMQYINDLLAHFVQRDGQKSRSNEERLYLEAEYVKHKNKHPLLRYWYKYKYAI